jgi:glutamate dehydrogenase (NAD(P)+)
MGCGLWEMGIAYNQWTRMHGNTPAIVTGKPLSLGGLASRESATGHGVALVTQQAVIENDYNIDTQTIAVQGFGNVGSWAALYLYNMGFKVVAISDIYNTLYNPAGLNIQNIFSHRLSGTSFTEIAAQEKVDLKETDDIYQIETDIFIPAALGNVIRADNVEKLYCWLIVEAANNPTTPEANQILIKRNCQIIPDVLANMGGVVVSYLEWVSSLQHMRPDTEQVEERLKSTMKYSYQEVSRIAQANHTTLRLAAYQLAVQRVLAAARAQGYV